MNKEAAKETAIYFGILLVAFVYMIGTGFLITDVSGWFVLLLVPPLAGIVYLFYSMCLDNINEEKKNKKKKKLNKGVKNGSRK